MDNNDMQVIEVNGIKMEIDTRHAKRIDTFRVGTQVKLLAKSDYGSPEVNTGVVVGFEPFDTLPTIIVCYLAVSYSSCELKFAHVNTESAKKYEIVASVDDDLPIQKSDVLNNLDREVEKHKREIEDIERKREYFLSHFNSYFEPEVHAE